MILDEVTIAYSLNGLPLQTFTLTDLNIEFGAEQEIDLPTLDFQEGVNTLEVFLQDPNGGVDNNPGNNSMTFTIAINNYQDRIPLRQNFEDVVTPDWTIINPQGGMNWEVTNTNFGSSLYFNAFNNLEIGDEAWFVSPVLDFSGSGQASMLFDLSHAPRTGVPGEKLRILASKDCGATFQEVPYNFPAADNSSNESWIPVDETEWHRNVAVNLGSVAGEPAVRIAFVVTNQNSNNLYLDNIEFYVTADPDPIEINELYSIYGYDLTTPEMSDLKITFNLPERQNVRFSIINATGQMETDGILMDVLNQTFPLSLSERLTPGVYFVRVNIGDRFYSSKILVY